MSLEENKAEIPQNIHEHHVEALKTYRYVTAGNKNKAKYIIYILHGYGQLSRYFIRRFSFLSEDFFVVAPEGMHRFYLNGNSGRVGASWMTKEDREYDIKDNLHYLNCLSKEIERDVDFEKRIILGFSQGGATAARWYYEDPSKTDHLILWATVFPPDLDKDQETNESSDKKNYFVLGKMDEFYNSDDQMQIINFYKQKGFRTLTFNGKHDIDQVTMKTILAEINSFRDQ
jgi:predicted esterase